MFNNDTMNAVFDINRFINVEKRNIVTDRMQYLYLASALLGLYVISTFIFAMFESSLGGSIPLLCICTIIFSPCLLGKSINKNNAIFDFMFPASTFEKFLSLFLKYVIFIPFLCFSIIFLLWGLSTILPFEVLNAHAKDLKVESWISLNEFRQMIAAQSIFFLGYFYFRRYAFAKTILSLILFSVFLAVIASIIFAFHTADIVLNFNLLGGSVDPNEPFISKLSTIVINTVLPVGMWIVAFFKLRETEI